MTLHYTMFGALLAVIGVQRTTAAETLGDVHFRFDSSALPQNAEASLAAAAAFAAEHPETLIVLDAHCDPIGTEPYNVRLAIRRADAVRDRLAALGVPHGQVVVSIYGEGGARRASYAEDRRVTMWPTREPVAEVIRRTFDGEGIAVTWGRQLTVAEIEATPVPVATR